MILTSLKSKIHIGFILIIILFLSTFWFYLEFEKQNKHKQFISYYVKTSDYIFENRLPPPELMEYVKNQGFNEVEDARDILHTAKLIYSKRGLEVFFLDDSYYIHILIPRFRILFKDPTIYNTTSYSYFVFLLLFIVLCFSYISILKAYNKNTLLLESRQLFLRTIMHELKTPIAKGRIVSELIKEDKQKERMITIFEKLNFLIDDFAKTEQIVSKNYSLNLSSYCFLDITNNAIEKLLLENNKNISVITSENRNLNTDYELISLAFKNLIDNALKYSNNKKVQIIEQIKYIEFISKGDKLPKPLEEYLKPFHNDTKNKNHGMGLGLYIVHTILEQHDFKLEYKYEEDLNIFRIVF